MARGIVVVKVYLEGGFSFEIDEDGATQVRAALPNANIGSVNFALAAGGTITVRTSKIVALTVE
jgi:hypothetical protein